MIDKILKLFRSRIDAMITGRIVMYHKHLVEQGLTLPSPTSGPMAMNPSYVRDYVA